MARMLPPVVAEDTPSRAEIRLFAKIESDLSDNWSAFHSIGLSTHHRKPWAEIDFVLVGPQGIYCLEVKGGGVARVDGAWTTTNDRGTFPLKESPFKQAGGAMSALYQFLLHNVPGAAELVVGMGVVFPDIHFSEQGLDVVNQIVFDREDVGLPFGKYVDRLARYWSDRVSAAGRTIRPIDSQLRRAVVRSLSSDFDLRPSIAVQVGQTEDELVRWTDRQIRVFQGIRDNERIIVRGGAGTGKTSLAVEEARQLAVTGRRVLLTCFNKELARYLSPLANNLPGLQVEHLHGFMRRVIDQEGRRPQIPDAQASDVFGVFFPQLATEILLERESPPYDAVVVDEGQDLLKDNYVDVLEASLRGGLRRGVWRLFLDPNQALFGGVGSGQLARWLSASPTQQRLLENCRNTPPIAASAALLSNTPMDEVLCRQGPAVVREYFDSDREALGIVAKVLREWLDKGLAPSQIAVLSAVEFHPIELASELKRHNVSITQPGSSDARAVRVATLASFKGLEAAAIVLVGIRDLLTAEGAMEAYVGQTRARALLALVLPRQQEPAVRLRAEEFGKMLVNQPIVS